MLVVKTVVPLSPSFFIPNSGEVANGECKGALKRINVSVRRHTWLPILGLVIAGNHFLFASNHSGSTALG